MRVRLGRGWLGVGACEYVVMVEMVRVGESGQWSGVVVQTINVMIHQ